MFGRSLTLFRIAGIDIRLDASWAFLALLIAWSLADGLFPELYQGWPAATYWWTAIAGVIGLLFSIIFHELAHSLVAQAYGIPVRGITLFIFGGMAQMEHEAKTPKVEFRVAIIGPISSLLLAGVFYALHLFAIGAQLPEPFVALTDYLTWLNTALAVFNLVPAFPMDGGRVLRAALWAWRGNFVWATRWASRFGQVFGIALMGLGIVWAAQGNFVGGLWWVLIGLFVRSAAQTSYQDVQFRSQIDGVPVNDLMDRHPVSVTPDVSVDDLVDTKVYEFNTDFVPVVEDARLVGCVGLDEIKQVPRERWRTTSVRQIMRPCSADVTIDQGTDAGDAIARMRRTGKDRLMVVRGQMLVGMLSLQDMLRRLAIKTSLEGRPTR